MKPKIFIDAWKKILAESPHPWVLFENGTVVILKTTEGKIEDDAREFLTKYGYAPPGTPEADFGVEKLENPAGYLVTTGGPEEIMTYVDDSELSKKYSEMMIGILGKTKRKHDRRDLHVIWVHRPEK